MCGNSRSLSAPSAIAPGTVERMRDRWRIAVRITPDSGDPAMAGSCLGHRRLSIIDLDPRSNQPMTSADGRLVITFNGEIYNYRAVRARPGA